MQNNVAFEMSKSQFLTTQPPNIEFLPANPPNEGL